MSSLTGMTFGGFLDAVAAKTPTPGGGAVASTVGAVSAALAGMVVSYSVNKKSLAAHKPRLEQAQAALVNARALLVRLAEEDAAAYGVVNELMKLPEGDPRRARDMPAAAAASVQVPMATAATCTDLLRLYIELAPITNTQLHSDLGIAAVLADACARSSAWNVRVNAGLLGGAERERSLAACAKLLGSSAELLATAEGLCRGRAS